MNIFIDESGSFALENSSVDSWCVVAAYVCPERQRMYYESALATLKLKVGVSVLSEIKLHQISEEDYFVFLNELSDLQGILLLTATDSGRNSFESVVQRQNNHAQVILDNLRRMESNEGRLNLQHLADKVTGLHPQQYVQLHCQILLMTDFMRRGINYFVQRYPFSLKTFRWRIDQKEPTKKISFEEVFEELSPVMLQAFSLQKPNGSFDWCNYEPMSEYIYRKGEIPDYLIEKFPYLINEEGFDVQKIVRDDLAFVDSKDFKGVQVADLLASGARRLLKRGFEDCNRAAQLLGSLMIQEEHDGHPIQLAVLGEDVKVDYDTSMLIHRTADNCRPMLHKDSLPS